MGPAPRALCFTGNTYTRGRSSGHTTELRRFGILIILSCRHLKHVKCTEGLSLTPLISMAINRLPRMSSTREGGLVARVETKARHHTRTNFVTNDPLSYLFFHGPFVFLINHLRSPKCLHSPSPSPMKTVYKLLNLTTFWGEILLFSPVTSHAHKIKN